MWKPKYFQEMITNRVIITKFGSPSQSCMNPPRPADFMPALTSDVGWSSRVKTTPVTASERTYGRKKITRKTPRPLKAPVQQDGEEQRKRDLDSQ